MNASKAGSALIGLVAGYAAWLLTGALIIYATPVRYWVGATVMVVCAMIVLSVLAARRNPSHSLIWWLVPVLPVLASGYWLFALVS